MLTQPIQNIIDEISRYQTQQAQNSINQLIQRNKKKQKLTTLELEQLKILMAQVQVMDMKFGEAYEFIDNLLVHGTIKQELDSSLMFLNINVAKELDLLGWITNSMPQLNKQDQITDLYYLYLQDHNFAQASKQALKLYKVDGERDHFIFFSYIFLNAESQPTNKGDKITLMFIDKLSKLINFDKSKSNFEGCSNVSLAQQVIKLELDFYKTHKDYKMVKFILQQHESFFSLYQQNIEHLKWLYMNEPSSDNLSSYINVNLALLQTHLQKGELFTQNFEAQKTFIKFLIDLIQQSKTWNLVQECIDKPQNVDQPFSISSIKVEEVLIHIYFSCFTLLQTIEDLMINRSLVLTFLYMVNEINQYTPIKPEQISTTLKIFYKYHGGKFSFFQEVFQALGNLSNGQQVIDLILDATYEVKDVGQLSRSQLESSVIRDLNLTKIRFLNKQEPIQELINQYNKADRKLYLDDHEVEKGDRLIQDDYLLMAIDILFQKALKAKKIESPESIENHILSLLIIEIGLFKSPYNFDLLMRQNQIYSLIGCADQVIETTQRLDIKGVQYDTVGFLFAKANLEFGASHDSLLKKNFQALTFYQENLRDSKKNLVSCVKQQSLDSFIEFYRFEDWIKNSYLWLIHLYTQTKILQKQSGLSEQSRAINIEWIYNKIVNQLNKQFIPLPNNPGYESPLNYKVLNSSKSTLNINGGLFQTQYVRDLPANLLPNNSEVFSDYLGLYQNPKMLLLEIKFQQIETLAKNITNDQSVIKQRIDETQIILNDFILDQNLQNHFQLAQGIIQQISDSFEIIEQFNFVKSNFDFCLNTSKLLIKVYQVSEESQANTLIIEVSTVQQQYTQIIDILLAHANEFSSETHLIPCNLFKKIHRFYSYTFPFAFLLITHQEEIKNKLFKLAKKASTEEAKKKINELSKSYSALTAFILESLKRVSKILIEKLNQSKDQYDQTINDVLLKFKNEPIFDELNKINQVSLEKTSKIFTQNLSSSLTFQNVKQSSLIEDRMKSLK